MWALSRNSDWGRVTWAAAMLASPGLAVRVGGQGRVGGRLVALEVQRELRLEGQGGAAADLEGLLRAAPPGTERGAPARECDSAGGRVEGEVGAIDLQGDRAHVERDPVEDGRDRVGDGVDLGGFGVEVEGGSDDDGAEVEGAGDRRGDDRQS